MRRSGSVFALPLNITISLHLGCTGRFWAVSTRNNVVTFPMQRAAGFAAI